MSYKLTVREKMTANADKLHQAERLIQEVLQLNYWLKVERGIARESEGGSSGTQDTQ